MASGSGSSGSADRKAKPYRKHRPLPALIVIGVLALGAVIVWVNAVVGKGDIDAVVRCDPAASPPPGTTFTPLPHDALDDRTPVPPDKISMRVLNASSVRGLAAITTAGLKDLGFSGAGEPAEDPAYDKREAKCRGQIRFGENGSAAARTLSLAVPCAELIQDNRKDASVDLATGKNFGDLRPTPQARQILQQLTTWSQQHQGGGGGEQATGAQAPVVDQTLLASARDVTC
ncbi:envelope integrity protein Cei [Amycolatopsis samaneae]|uniref:Envelope integrity protein Cei n=1 Tax=Amycolatopsis samaneae TaxID=664691 RepID=A0ABW5GCQ2_9PSEU